MRLKLLATAAVLLAPVVSAYRYPDVRIQNRTMFAATVQVSFAGCRGDRFVVPAAQNKNGVLVPGASAPLKRFSCLVTSITATLAGTDKPVTEFKSQPTSVSNFTLAPSGQNFSITADPR